MRLPFAPHSGEALLPQATAEHILSNVLSACKREPNSVPLEALTSYSNYRKERYSLQRTLILLMLTLFLLLPLLFFAAGISVIPVNPDSSENPVYAVSVSTQLPIRQIEARLNGQTVPLYEVSPGNYTFIPRSNGDMHISATLINRQVSALDVQIRGVDTDAPTLVSTEIGTDRIFLIVEDSGSGVDYEHIAITDDAGTSFALLNWDAASGRIAIPYPTRTLHVSIPDLRGNVLRADLKPQ